MHGEYVLMRDGKIIVLRNGEEMPMEEEMEDEELRDDIEGQ